MSTYSVQDLIEAADIDVDSEEDGIDELCSHTFTTLGSSQGRVYGDDEFEFKIKNIDTNADTHKITIQWFQVGGDVITSQTEGSEGEYNNKYVEEGPHPIQDEIIHIMKASRKKL